MLTRAIALTLADLLSLRLLPWVLLGLLIGGALFAALVGGIGWLLAGTALLSIGWLETALDLLGGFATVLLAALLFPGLVAAGIGLIADPIAATVEARSHPALPRPRAMPFSEIAVGAVRFALLSVAVNLLILPLYLIPGLNVVVYLLANGYLVGREFFDQAALRRLSPADAGRLRRRLGASVPLAGVGLAAALAVPVINLIAPVAAVAVMTHLVALSQPR